MLTFPDSQIPLYIAFLAWDEFAATHDQDDLGGAPRVAGERDPDADSEKLTGIALKIADDLIKEANASVEEGEYVAITLQIGDYAREL